MNLNCLVVSFLYKFIRMNSLKFQINKIELDVVLVVRHWCLFDAVVAAHLWSEVCCECNSVVWLRKILQSDLLLMMHCGFLVFCIRLRFNCKCCCWSVYKNDSVLWVLENYLSITKDFIKIVPLVSIILRTVYTTGVVLELEDKEVSGIICQCFLKFVSVPQSKDPPKTLTQVF